MKVTFSSPTVKLYNGVEMPKIGLGVYGMHGEETEKAVTWALEMGYRHIDTAALYRNEREVGRAIKASGIPRDEIFVTTKLYPTNFLWAEAAFQTSLEKLNLDYVDLYLIHWPAPGKNRAWKVLENIYHNKLSRSIGVSNYSISQLDELKNRAEIMPMVNQVEFHPFSYRKELLEYCRKNNIAFEAYSPLSRGKQIGSEVLAKIAERMNKSSAQVMLRWSVQHGAIIIPKSVHQEWILENSKVFDFELGKEDMVALDGF